jgi:hypothetical protein
MSQIMAPETGDREYAAVRDTGARADPSAFGCRQERSGTGGTSLVDNRSWAGISTFPRNMGTGRAPRRASMQEVGSSNRGEVSRDPDQRPQVWRSVHRVQGHSRRNSHGYSLDGGPDAVSRQTGTKQATS